MTGRHRRPSRASTLKPSRQVTAATAAAAAASLLFRALGTAGVDVPGDVQGEVTVLAVFAAGWLRRP